MKQSGGTVVAFSGGKDSTAMALRLHELGERFDLLHTPTGDELPDVAAHVERVATLVDERIITPPALSLARWIDEFGALPNWRQRWCTRLTKIEPCIAMLQARPGSILCVGLRADEEERVGLYGEHATYRYPLREWGWNIDAVWSYLRARCVEVPVRTDCALCYGQRLDEWWMLWRDHPEAWARGEALEERTGHTFRSPSRDSWPASMRELRRLFEAGRRPRKASVRLQLRLLADADGDGGRCRVCTL